MVRFFICVIMIYNKQIKLFIYSLFSNSYLGLKVAKILLDYKYDSIFFSVNLFF